MYKIKCTHLPEITLKTLFLSMVHIWWDISCSWQSRWLPHRWVVLILCLDQLPVLGISTGGIWPTTWTCMGAWPTRILKILGTVEARQYCESLLCWSIEIWKSGGMLCCHVTFLTSNMTSIIFPWRYMLRNMHLLLFIFQSQIDFHKNGCVCS